MFSWIDFLFIFAVGSTAGWLVELLYRRDLKKLTSGFLNGPYLPVYGFGLVLVYIISLFDMNLFLRAAVFGISLTVLELIAGLIFVKYFRIKLWDYSNRFLNFKGLICLKHSVYFTIMAMLFYFFILPWIVIALGFTRGNEIVYFILGIFYTVFVIDNIISFSIAGKIKSAVVEFNQKHLAKVVVDYNNFRENVVDYLKKTREANCVLRFIFTINNLVSNEVKCQINKFLKKEKKC